MYLSNKYSTWYHSIIANARSQYKTEYTEQHHIIPKSLGGTDEPENLVRLTAREHFICHKLLTKFTTGDNKKKMIFAYRCLALMCNNNHSRYQISSREFNNIRSLKFNHTAESINKMKGRTAWNLGLTTPDYVKEKLSVSLKGRAAWNKGKSTPHSDQAKINMSLAKIGKSRKPFSAETKAKMAEAARNRKKSTS